MVVITEMGSVGYIHFNTYIYLLLGPIDVLMPGPIRKLGGGLRRRRHGLRDGEDRSGVHAVELW